MKEQERKNIIEKVSPRIAKSVAAMSPYGREQYIKKLLSMVDDTHLIALEIAHDLTSEGEEK